MASTVAPTGSHSKGRLKEDPNTAHPIDTANLQLQSQNLAEWLLIKQVREKPIMKQVGKAETQSCHKPIDTAIHKGRTLLSEEQRFWTPHWTPQLLRPTPERQAPRTSCLEGQRDWHPTRQPLSEKPCIKDFPRFTHPRAHHRGSWLIRAWILCERGLFA